MCENCDEDEVEREKDYLYMRFIGGRHLKYPHRGEYNTYETGKVYLVPPENKALLYWEEVDEAEKTDEPEPKVEVELEVVDEEADLEIQLPSSGLTKAFGGGPLTEKDLIMSMDVRTLRAYIEGQGGKVDGRWGPDTLREKALKLQ